MRTAEHVTVMLAVCMAAGGTPATAQTGADGRQPVAASPTPAQLLDTQAQPQTTAEPSASPDAEPAKPKSVDEAVAEATAILDRLDANFGEPPTREDIEALGSLLTVVQRGGRADPRLDYLTGRILALSGKSRASTAISALQRYVETREGRNDWKAHRVLGDLFVDEYARLALSSYQKAAELKPGEPSVLMGLSLGYYGVGDRPKALDYAKELVKADGGVHIPPIAHLARMYAANQQWDEANRMATAALQKAQQSASGGAAIAGPADPAAARRVLVTLQEQYDLLIAIVQSSIGAAQPTPDQYASIARYSRERAAASHKLALNDVLALLKRALETAIDDSAPLLQEYAVALAELGHNAEAIETFEKLLTIDPSNALAAAWLPRLKSAPGNAPED